MKKLIVSLLLILSFITLTSCSKKSESAKTSSDIIVMAIAVDPDGLDPHATASASTFQITSNIYETLLSVDENGAFIPALAKEWKVSDDGLSIAFTLRDNAKFSNGKICDANAVIASFNRLKSDKSIRGKDYENIIGITALDNNTVVFSFKELDVASLASFAYPWAAIVDASEENLKNNPVGTGPYKLSSWMAQESLVLAKNEYYTGEVKNDGVRFVVMPDLTAEITALERGEVDIILITGDLASAVLNKGYNLIDAPTNGLQLMAMNNKNEALSDKRVREAINYAVDKKALIESVWNGYGVEIGSHFPVVLKEYVDLAGTYSYDPEKAIELLKESGYYNNLELKMYLPKNYQEYVNAGQIIAAELVKVGIKVDVNIVEWAYWLSEVYGGRNYDLTVVGHTGRLDPYALLVKYKSDGKENYFNYANSEVDQLLASYKVCTDMDQRTEYAKEIQRILSDDVPALYIQDPIQIFVTKSEIEGFKNYPINIYNMKEVKRVSK